MVQTKENNVEKNIDSYVAKAQIALNKMASFSQEKVDKICEEMVKAALDNKELLAKMAVEETGRGKVEDKVIKNTFASETIWEDIKDKKTVGIVNEDKKKGLVEIAEPKGIIAGLTPVTNPTSTVIFKSLIAMKTRNAIIFAFHPQAQKSCVKTAEILRDAAVKAGAPENCIQWIEDPSLEATTALINNSGVQTILATGGPGMVKAAYSSGKPALGVGPGNGPAYIEKSADIEKTVYDIMLSKTFDNGMICASENSVVVDEDIYDKVKAEFKSWNCYFLNKEEIKRFEKTFIDPKRGTVAGPIAGKSAVEIAKYCGIEVPANTKVLVAEYDGVGKDYPLSAEKLSPVFTLYKAKDQEDAFEICRDLLNYGGRGHTAGIHSEDNDVIKAFALAMSACRILVNTPSALGGIGGIFNAMTPSLTLGTGSYGANSMSHNISINDLMNIKTVAFRTKEFPELSITKD